MEFGIGERIAETLFRFRTVREGLTALKKVTVLVQPASKWTSCGISERMTWEGTFFSVMR